MFVAPATPSVTSSSGAALSPGFSPAHPATRRLNLTPNLNLRLRFHLLSTSQPTTPNKECPLLEACTLNTARPSNPKS